MIYIPPSLHEAVSKSLGHEPDHLLVGTKSGWIRVIVPILWGSGPLALATTGTEAVLFESVPNYVTVKRELTRSSISDLSVSVLLFGYRAVVEFEHGDRIALDGRDAVGAAERVLISRA